MSGSLTPFLMPDDASRDATFYRERLMWSDSRHRWMHWGTTPLRRRGTPLTPAC